MRILSLFRFFIGSLLGSSIVFSNALAQSDSQRVLLHHHTFQDFSKGKFSDAGCNIYVSKHGNIQYKNIFDLDFDGFPEVILNNDHNHYDTPDIIFYRSWGLSTTESLFQPAASDAPYYQSFAWTAERMSSIFRLPSSGGGRALVADVNGDGYDDLLVTNFIHGWTLSCFPVLIYWGGADGFNMLRRSLLPADRATAVAVADVTGDGLPDIIAANPGREVEWLSALDKPHNKLGELAGRREQTSYLFRQTEAGFHADSCMTIRTQFAIDVKVIDLTGNGKQALVFLELGRPGALRIIPITEGKLDRPQVLPIINPRTVLQGKPFNRRLCIADLDNDGLPDIFVPSEGNQSEIFWNRGGGFSTKNRSVMQVNNVADAAAADLNEDGFIDLVTACFFSSQNGDEKQFATDSYIWWGHLEGFKDSRRTSLRTTGPSAVCLEDVDGDGRADILFAQHQNGRTFDVPSYIYLNSPVGFSSNNQFDLQGYGAVDVVVADADGNGCKEIGLINSISGTVTDRPPLYIYRGNPSRTYNTNELVKIPPSSPETNIAFADMEDNGDTDLIYLVDQGHELAIMPRVMYDSRDKEEIKFRLPFRGNTVNVADFNRDGILDVLVTPLAGPQAALFFGKGDRRYREKFFEFNFPAYSCSIGDLNNDGILDAVTSGHRMITVLFGKLHGSTFGFEPPRLLPSDYFTTRISIADMNDDGWNDLFCQNFHNDVTNKTDVDSWILFNRNGVFSLNDRQNTKTYGAQGGTVARLTETGEVNLLVSNYHGNFSRRVATFLLSIDAFGVPEDKPVFRFPSQSSSANYVMDFDGDGFQDVLVQNHSGTGVFTGGLMPMGGTHGVGSELFWGAEDGFDIRRKSWIPSFGPHGRIVAEAGSIGRREPFEMYTSDIQQNTTRDSSFILNITGRFNAKQYCIPEIVMEPGDGMSNDAHLHPVGSVDGIPASSWKVTIPPGMKFRYRLKLWGGYNGGGTKVSSIKLVSDNVDGSR